MHKFEYSAVSSLHSDIQARIQEHKQMSPMAAVVLVTDSPLQGLLLRRQLVESATSVAVGNIQVKMIDEVVADVFRELGEEPGSFPSEAALDAACYSAMLNNPIFASTGSEALTTANGIATVYSKLRFNSDADLVKLLSGQISDTQKAVIESVLSARNILKEKLGVTKLPEKIEGLIGDIKPSRDAQISNTLYLILTENMPKLLNAFFETFPFCVRYEIAGIEANINSADKFFTSPDPQTESELAVAQVVDLVDAETDPVDIAITYASGQHYGRLLGTALDDSGIVWNGAVDTISQSSNLYRGFDLILQMLEKRTATRSGVDRPLLMRLLESGDFFVDDMLLEANMCRQFVRDKEIYGDAVGWLKVIGKLPNPARLREVKAAEELKALLKSLQRALQRLSESKTWEQFGSELFEVVRNFYLGVNEENLSDDEKNVIKMFKQVLLQELPELDLLKPENLDGLLPSASAVRSFINRKVGQKNHRHGSLAVGVHLSSIQDIRILNFKKIILVGATDGLLPSPLNEMSFLTDQMLESLGELGQGATSVTDKPDLLGRQLSAIVAGKSLVITRSRSAMAGKLDDVPSRFLNLQSIPEATVIESFNHIRSASSGVPITSRDVQAISKSLENDKALEPSQKRTLEALSIFRSPTGQDYFGKVSSIPELHSIATKGLSASSIEAFIDCEYKFFVTRTLGFYTGERQDTLEIWRAKDFGNLIHNSMENFLNDLSGRGELPKGQQPFTDSQVESYFANYLDEELKDFYAKGHDVWRSGFETLMERVKANLRDFFSTELGALRASNDLAVHASELAFGNEEVEKDKTILQVPGREPVGLTGRIDRVDIDEDQAKAGVLDFKSGKLDASDLKKQLGRPKERNPNRDLVQRTKVQDLVYTVALRQKYPSLENVEVTFAYISSGTKTEYVKAEWAEPAEEKLAAIVGQIYSAEDNSSFPVTHSSKIGENTYCDVCQRLGWVAEQLRIEYVNAAGIDGGGDDDE